MVILVALFLRAPQAGEVVVPADPAVQQTRRDYGRAEVLKTPPFWVMYAMFVMVGAGGLMAVAQLAPIANDYKIAGVPVSILGLDPARAHLRLNDRSDSQRHLPAVLRLGVRPHRS